MVLFALLAGIQQKKGVRVREREKEGGRIPFLCQLILIDEPQVCFAERRGARETVLSKYNYQKGLIFSFFSPYLISFELEAS